MVTAVRSRDPGSHCKRYSKYARRSITLQGHLGNKTHIRYNIHELAGGPQPEPAIPHFQRFGTVDKTAEPCGYILIEMMNILLRSR